MSEGQRGLFGTPETVARGDHRRALQSPGDQHTCGVCGVRQTVRRRPLSRQMAAFLCALVRWEERAEDVTRYWSAREFMVSDGHKASSDGTYLVAWRFVDPGPERGTWRSTAAGRLWAKGGASAAPAVWIVEPQGKTLGLDTEADPVTISQCWPVAWDAATHPRRT